MGSSIVGNIPLLWRMLIVGQAMQVRGRGVYGLSRKLSLAFPVNLKLVLKKIVFKTLKKKSASVHFTELYFYLHNKEKHFK